MELKLLSEQNGQVCFFLDSPWPLSQHSGLHKQTESGAEITSCAPPLFCENLVLFLSADRTCFSFASCDEKHHGILWLSSLSYYTKPHMTITIFAKCFPDAMRRRCNRQRFRHSSVFFFSNHFFSIFLRPEKPMSTSAVFSHRQATHLLKQPLWCFGAHG